MYPGTDIRPKFEVIRLNGKQTVPTITYVNKRIPTHVRVNAAGKEEQEFKIVKERIVKTKEVPMGYGVHLSNGNVLHVRTEEELLRLGFNGKAPLVDHLTGEELPQAPTTLAEKAAARNGVLFDFQPSTQEVTE